MTHVALVLLGMGAGSLISMVMTAYHVIRETERRQRSKKEPTR